MWCIVLNNIQPIVRGATGQKYNSQGQVMLTKFTDYLAGYSLASSYHLFSYFTLYSPRNLFKIIERGLESFAGGGHSFQKKIKANVQNSIVRDELPITSHGRGLF